MRFEIRRLHTRRLVLFALAAALAACRSRGNSAPEPRFSQWEQELLTEFGHRPDTLPTKWRGLIGEYGPDTTNRWFVLERDRRLNILDPSGNYIPLSEKSDSLFDAPISTAPVSGEVRFSRDSTGRGTRVQAGDRVMPRRRIEPPSGANQLRITPVRPVEELRREALAAKPPADSANIRLPELVDVPGLDSTIKLEIRYATSNNFLGTPVYESARAFLQRPAAEALVRANKTLKALGFGLLIHDAYRPWYVTKIFWDATPDSLKWLVANPAEGSKHNRGAAVDLTLYDLDSGRPVDMPSTYDESTTRAKAGYPGGTAMQRWNRALLRRVMEHEGFAVNPNEWWHFDYKDWKSYPILNVPFDQVRPVVLPAKR